MLRKSFQTFFRKVFRDICSKTYSKRIRFLFCRFFWESMDCFPLMPPRQPRASMLLKVLPRVVMRLGLPRVLVSESFDLLQAMKIKNQENSKKNQKPEFFKVNQKFKKYSKNNRKYGGTPVFLIRF